MDWKDRPAIPDDLSGVPLEALESWRASLGHVILDVQEQLSRAADRVRTERWLPKQEYADLCDWQRRARAAKLSMQQDVTRLRQQIRARIKLAGAGRNKRTYRDRLMDLLDNLACDEALSEGTRGAADEFLLFLEREDDEREKRDRALGKSED